MRRLQEAILSYLLSSQIIDKKSSQDIIAHIQKSKKNLGTTLLEHNYLEKEDLLVLIIDLYKNKIVNTENINEYFSLDIEYFLQRFAQSMNYQYLDLDSVDIDYKVASKVSLDKLKKAEALPIKEDDLNIYVAFKDPLNILSQELVQRLFSKKLLKIIVSEPSKIDKYLNKMGLNESIKGLIEDIRAELASNINSNPQESSGVLKLIETVMKTVIVSGGSDVHIEPTQNSCIIRSRIDGILSETFIFDKDVYPPLSSRLKLLANIDIAEKRKPQDGRFSAKIMGKEYDFRISTLPILNGESIVIRILDKSKAMIKLENLGMYQKNYNKFSQAMKAPYGIIFVTGPTGSGKTTTLYAALNAIKSVQTKIITVEDPVEYQLNLTFQSQVNEKAGLTFASALRSILRQDPDIIMIGEVRDQETLRIAIQAALTGHLVFSTLHTNDSISAVTRILDMGIESYLVSGALVAIEAQRLIRKLCIYCKKPISLSDSMYKDLKSLLPNEYQFYKSVGCERCSNTGFKGREMVSEILLISEKIASMIAKGESKEALAIQAEKEGFINMYKDGVSKAAKGITSIDEILRVTKA